MKQADIKNAQPGDVLKDDQVTGLSLRVGQKKSSWYLYYRNRAGVERRPRIANFPTATLTQARDIAKRLLAEVAMGNDPSDEWQKQKKLITLGELYSLFKQDRFSSFKPHTQRKYSGLYDLYLSKHAHMKVEHIGPDRVKAWHGALCDKPVQANKLVAFLRTLTRWGVQHDLLSPDTNLTRKVRYYKERGRRRYMTTHEATRLAGVLEKYKPTHPWHVSFIYLLIYTGARKSEIANAKWKHLQGNKLELPDSKTNQPRTIYLPAPAMDVIDSLPLMSDYMLGIRQVDIFWRKVRTEAGMPDMHLHDLRHSFASTAISAGLTLAQVGELLGHQSQATTHRYAHLMDDAAQSFAEQVGGILEGSLSGSRGQTAADLDGEQTVEDVVAADSTPAHGE